MAGVTGFRIKFQEAGGSKLIASFDKDFGKGQHFGRKTCDYTNKRQNCRSINLVYESSCMNSKNEYLANCISRLTIEEDTWERRERYRQDEEAEKLEVAEVEAFLRSKQHIQMN